ncbi:MAG: transposase domain-containing protein [Butyrivibrio sp.]|nr:transposase domain-containing protein [Acetatifactor muris]MCM1558274.1 transposase domain-containing protein [Butyrivibrio sp.]
MIYSLSETAKLNKLKPYYYFKYLLMELPKLSDEEGNIESSDWIVCCPGQRSFQMKVGNHAAEYSGVTLLWGV